MKATEGFFLFFFSGILLLSLFLYFRDNGSISRILLYYRLSNSEAVGLRLRFSCLTKEQINEKVYDYLRVMLGRPPSAFLKTVFENSVELEGVRVVDDRVYVGLICAEKFAVDEKGKTLLEKGIRSNFPLFKSVHIFCIKEGKSLFIS